MIATFITEQRDAIMEAAKRHGAKNVRVFGSAARGEVLPESDVDFLVELDAGRSLLDQSALLIELQDILGRRVDVVEPAGLHHHIKDKILADATAL